MRAAIYARVSTPRQARDQNTDQQIARLERYAEHKGWVLDAERVYLDALRDAAAMAEFEVVLLTAHRRDSHASHGL